MIHDTIIDYYIKRKNYCVELKNELIKHWTFQKSDICNSENDLQKEFWAVQRFHEKPQSNPESGH